MEIISTWWPLILSAIAGIVWLVRLEGKMFSDKQALIMHQKSCAERHLNDTKTTDEIKRALDKVFDILRDVQGDVKEIRGWKDGLQKR